MPAAPATVKPLVSRLTRLAAGASHTLDLPGLRAAFNLYQASERSPAVQASLAALAPEYTQVESLRVLDRLGQPAPVDPEFLAELAGQSSRAPGFAAWIAPAEGGVLAARWLCHLVGLRHATVELFIDHPTRPGLTLLQVRGYQKASAPGCFDLPVAGHVDGLLSPLEGLKKECREELGLDLAADGVALVDLGGYESSAVESGARLKNIEYRFVYRCRPAGSVWLSLRPDPEELAGLAIFSSASLQEALARDEALPRKARRFASGIREALPLYLASDH